MSAYHHKNGEKNTYVLAGIDVEFPYTAYGTQLALMSRIITALKQQKHALLESPTGTGKTCSLLCAALAWQRVSQLPLAGSDQEQLSDADSVSAAEAAQGPSFKRQIFYCSRTHSQLSQVIGELRRLSKQPVMAVLGSRGRLCIDERVKQQENPTAGCKRLLRGRGCEAKENVGALRDHKSVREGPWDIEDLVMVGEALKACPYYAARDLAEDAELVALPYNYLLSPATRKALSIRLEGAVVILDEAHNIEDVCRDEASCDLSVELMLLSLEHIIQLHDYAARFPPNSLPTNRLPIVAYSAVSSFLRTTLDWLDSIALIKLSSDSSSTSTSSSSTSSSSTSIPFGCRSFAWPCKELRAVLNRWGVTEETQSSLQKHLHAILEDTSPPPPIPGEPFSDPPELPPAVIGLLGQLSTLFNFLFTPLQGDASAPQPFDTHYRLVLRETLDARTGAVSLSLMFWCLYPGVAFAPLRACHSVLLCSGTLSPMDSFSSELGFDFSLRFSGAPVVDVPEQVRLLVIPQGPDASTPLNTSFRLAADLSVQDQLGAALLQVISRVPQGALCFFPSYSLLDRLLARWHLTGAFDELSRVKTVFVEPRSASGADFARILDDFHAAVASRHKNGGALFLAVFRGKVSEGLDFSDESARAVILAGIPYPNVMDEGVRLKREFNDAHPSLGLLSGSQWYHQAAFRALNQALGRCIRHRDDYGAIVLMDNRFQLPTVQSQLSKWLRPAIRPSSSFAAQMASLEEFFAPTQSRPQTSSSTRSASASDQVTLHASRPVKRRPVPSKVFDPDAPIDRSLASYFKKSRQG